jgi:hypothetical protein
MICTRPQARHQAGRLWWRVPKICRALEMEDRMSDPTPINHKTSMWFRGGQEYFESLRRVMFCVRHSGTFLRQAPQLPRPTRVTCLAPLPPRVQLELSTLPCCCPCPRPRTSTAAAWCRWPTVSFPIRTATYRNMAAEGSGAGRLPGHRARNEALRTLPDTVRAGRTCCCLWLLGGRTSEESPGEGSV